MPAFRVDRPENTVPERSINTQLRWRQPTQRTQVSPHQVIQPVPENHGIVVILQAVRPECCANLPHCGSDLAYNRSGLAAGLRAQPAHGVRTEQRKSRVQNVTCDAEQAKNLQQQDLAVRTRLARCLQGASCNTVPSQIQQSAVVVCPDCHVWCPPSTDAVAMESPVRKIVRLRFNQLLRTHAADSCMMFEETEYGRGCLPSPSVGVLRRPSSRRSLRPYPTHAPLFRTTRVYGGGDQRDSLNLPPGTPEPRFSVAPNVLVGQ